MAYLPEFEYLAHRVAGVPRDGVLPDAFAAEAEEADKEICHAEKGIVPLTPIAEHKSGKGFLIKVSSVTWYVKNFYRSSSLGTALSRTRKVDSI